MLLSLIMDGRNDNYHGAFRERASLCINILGRSVAKLKEWDRCELVVADWNSETPLADTLELVPEAKAITRFISIPKSATDPQAGDAPFPDSIITNAGIRRGKGTYRCWIGADVVVLPASLHAMLAVLDGTIPTRVDPAKAFLVAGRRHVPMGQTMRRPKLDAFEAYLERNAAYFPAEAGGAGHAAPTNLMGASWDVWQEIRGIDETMVNFSFNDICLALRMTQRYPLLNFDHYCCNLLHLEHWKSREYRSETTERKFNDTHTLVKPFAVNGESWGLGGHEFSEKSYDGS